MVLDKRNVYISIFVVSILGLAIVQHQYLRVGMMLARTQFAEKIQRSAGEIQLGLESRNQLTFLIGSVLEKDTTFFRTSPDSVLSASRHFLRDYLRESFVKNGVTADFDFVLKTRDAQYYLEGPEGRKEAESDEYPIPLRGYLPETFDKEFVLYIRFDPLKGYFLSQLNGLIYPSIFFLAGILLTVIWALRTYYWQRKTLQTTHEFLDNLTHELRTPVFSIQLAARLMQEKSSNSDDKLISLIKTQTARLTDHIDRVLQLAALERQRGVFQVKTFDLHETLTQLCKEYTEVAELDGFRFQCDLGPGPYPIEGDDWHLSNAVFNLLDNARKYSDQPEIALRAYRNGKSIVVEVEDNGCGIPEREHQRIFEKYYRVLDGNLHPVKGFGLGLNYVQKVVRKSRGRIELQSELGKGTVFRLIIPRKKIHGEN